MVHPLQGLCIKCLKEVNLIQQVRLFSMKDLSETAKKKAKAKMSAYVGGMAKKKKKKKT